MRTFQENSRLILCGLAVAIAAFSHAGAGIAPVRSTGTAQSILQSQIRESVSTLKGYVKDELKRLDDLQNAAGGLQVVEGETRRNNVVLDGLQRQHVELEKKLDSLSGYDDFKEKFDKLRLAIDKGMEDVGNNPSRDELEKQAEAEQEDAKEKQKAAEEAQKAAENGEMADKDDGTPEQLSEAAQKAVDEERQRRKTEAEEKAKAEGKDPSEAVWDDLTDDEIIAIADKADGLEDISAADRAEADKLKKTYNQGK